MPLSPEGQKRVDEQIEKKMAELSADYDKQIGEIINTFTITFPDGCYNVDINIRFTPEGIKVEGPVSGWEFLIPLQWIQDAMIWNRISLPEKDK